MMSKSRRYLIATSTIAAMLFAGSAAANADQGFQNFIAKFQVVAAKSGITAQTYNAAFAGVTDIDPVVLEKAHFQPEFKSPMWDYIDNRVQEKSIATGRAMAKKYKPWLDKIEAKFGVDRNILMAIWSLETNYGDILTKPGVVRSVTRSLATLAYADKPRAKYARTQLIAALKIMQRGDTDAAGLQGSWAGAMGQTQFIPTSYLLYGVDMDGNGHRNIWTSVPDALATSANLLRKNGWQTGKTWGYEVSLPAGAKAGATKSLDAWAASGASRANGKPFRNGGDAALLKLPDGKSGPAFLMLKNFRVIKAYNNADKYALAVGLLADQIAGGAPTVRDWNRPFTRLSIPEKEELQKRLGQAGVYDGEVDGSIGSGTKAAILAYQNAAGLTPDGYPSKELLDYLRSK